MTNLQITSLHFIDWIIVGIYLTLSLGLGLFFAKKVRNMVDFVSAGRQIGLYLGVASMAGTEMGLITIMYSAQKGFSGGFAAFHIAVVAGIITFLVGLSGFIVVPLRRHNVLTIPEFYEKRFGKSVRVLGGLLLTFGGILNMGLFLKVGALFLVGVAGFSPTWLPWVMTALLILILVYTCMGGMWSVIMTDFMQFCVMSLGLLTVVALSLYQLGWTPLFDVVLTQKGLAGFDPLSAEGDFGLSYVLWMMFTAGLVSCAIWPTAVARALAMKSEHLVKKQYMITSVTFMIRFLIPYFIGIAAFVYFTTEKPDLMSLFGTELDTLYAFPFYIKDLLPIGLIGFFTAAMIAAFMSTHDGYLLCWSSVITQDIIAPLSKKNLSEKQRLFWTRISIIGIGIYIWYWGLFYEGSDDIWDYMAITGAIYFTGAFALLVGGLYWKQASQAGAFAALLAGLTALLGLGPIKQLVGLSSFTGAQIGLCTIALTVCVMVIVSLLYPDKNGVQHTP